MDKAMKTARGCLTPSEKTIILGTNYEMLAEIEPLFDLGAKLRKHLGLKDSRNPLRLELGCGPRYATIEVIRAIWRAG